MSIVIHAVAGRAGLDKHVLCHTEADRERLGELFPPEDPQGAVVAAESLGGALGVLMGVPIYLGSCPCDRERPKVDGAEDARDVGLPPRVVPAPFDRPVRMGW